MEIDTKARIEEVVPPCSPPGRHFLLSSRIPRKSSSPASTYRTSFISFKGQRSPHPLQVEPPKEHPLRSKVRLSLERALSPPGHVVPLATAARMLEEALHKSVFAFLDIASLGMPVRALCEPYSASRWKDSLEQMLYLAHYLFVLGSQQQSNQLNPGYAQVLPRARPGGGWGVPAPTVCGDDSPQTAGGSGSQESGRSRWLLCIPALCTGLNLFSGSVCIALSLFAEEGRLSFSLCYLITPQVLRSGARNPHVISPCNALHPLMTLLPEVIRIWIQPEFCLQASCIHRTWQSAPKRSCFRWEACIKLLKNNAF